MKRAIALSGGGSRGSYELGVWTVLRELNIDYQIVTGTSIGALNGALMVQQDYELACELWNDITVDHIMVDGINLDFSFETLFSQKNQLKAFLKKYINSKGVDITPLIKLIDRVIDEQRVRDSAIDFGLVTVQYPSLIPLEITKREMEQQTLKQYLLASASCFPAFPICTIGDKSYIDGGYYDNLPINLAIKMNAEEVVAVDLSFNNDSEFRNKPFVTYISPSWPLGPFLSFNKETMQRNRLLGFNDAMKAYDQYDGYRYTFTKDDQESQYSKLSRSFVSLVALYEANIPTVNIKVYQKQADKTLLTSLIREHTGGKTLSYSDYFIRGSEICAELLRLNPLPVYDFSAFNKMLLKPFENTQKFRYDSLFSRLLLIKDHSILTKVLKEMDKQYLIGCFFYKVLNSSPVQEDLKWLIALVPNEFTAALYLMALHQWKEEV